MRILAALLGLLAGAAYGQQTGDAALTWAAPTQNTDGSAYVNGDGWRVYWGPTLGNYPNSTRVLGSQTNYQVVGLAPGQWYFAVTAINASGVESVFSNAASKVIPGALPGKAGLTVSTQPDPPPALVTVTLSNFDDASPSPEMTLAITGSGPVTLAIMPSSSFWDWCNAPGPTLGGNDSKGLNAITVTAPITTHCDVDGTQPFLGANVTVAGVTKALARVGSTWTVAFP